jgi:hypothetical protein
MPGMAPEYVNNCVMSKCELSYRELGWENGHSQREGLGAGQCRPQQTAADDQNL